LEGSERESEAPWFKRGLPQQAQATEVAIAFRVRGFAVLVDGDGGIGVEE